MYPGGKGPLFMGVIRGAGVATDTEEVGPGPAACEEPAAPAAAATPELSCWLEPLAANAWEDPSEAGPSLSSLGEELLEEAKNGNANNRMNLLILDIFLMWKSVKQMTGNKITAGLTRRGSLPVRRRIERPGRSKMVRGVRVPWRSGRRVRTDGLAILHNNPLLRVTGGRRISA